MHVELEEDPAAVAAVLSDAVERRGWRLVGRQLGLRSTPRDIPSVTELQVAARDYQLATLILTAE